MTNADAHQLDRGTDPRGEVVRRREKQPRDMGTDVAAAEQGNLDGLVAIHEDHGIILAYTARVAARFPTTTPVSRASRSSSVSRRSSVVTSPIATDTTGGLVAWL